jgi:hypothetical protein
MSKSAEEAILDLQPVAVSRYEAVDLNRLAVFAVGWLTDEAYPPRFENIVAVLFRLFPGKFSLAGYDLPDANRVNRALLQLGPKYRNWARGSTKVGYALTPDGEVVLRDVRRRLESGDVSRATHGAPSGRYTWDPSTDLTELRETSAFRRFVADGASTLSLDDVWNALNAFAYTPRDALRSRLVALKRVAGDAQDQEVGQFVDAMRAILEAREHPTRQGGRRRA